ncbi:MAG TPA: hypothetical protein VGX23_35235 [Actinocrinis sp.]|nr:hypothetical protein [Actinocrinis sp.]
MSRKPKEPKPLVKIPKTRVGRAVFFGSQAAGALTAARAIKTARDRGDRLELVHGVLTAAVIAATALLALRNTRTAHEIVQGEIVEPLMLTSGSGSGSGLSSGSGSGSGKGR